jgi:hypothetical protein
VVYGFDGCSDCDARHRSRLEEMANQESGIRIQATGRTGRPEIAHLMSFLVPDAWLLSPFFPLPAATEDFARIDVTYFARTSFCDSLPGRSRVAAHNGEPWAVRRRVPGF